MKLDIYQVDAFAKEIFKGNPAAVCPLDEWIDAELMQKIALENNLARRRFLSKKMMFTRFAGLRRRLKLIFADTRLWRARL